MGSTRERPRRSLSAAARRLSTSPAWAREWDRGTRWSYPRSTSPPRPTCCCLRCLPSLRRHQERDRALARPRGHGGGLSAGSSGDHGRLRWPSRRGPRDAALPSARRRPDRGRAHGAGAGSWAAVERSGSPAAQLLGEQEPRRRRGRDAAHLGPELPSCADAALPGITAQTADRDEEAVSEYTVERPGFNYRIDHPRSALVRARLPRLDDDNRRRAELDAAYRSRSQARSASSPPPRLPRATTSHCMFTASSPGDRPRRVRRELAQRGVQPPFTSPRST